MNPNQASDDNRSNQLNPNNDAYWQSRGGTGRAGEADQEDGDDAAEWERMKRGIEARAKVRAFDEQSLIETILANRRRDGQ